MIAIPTDRVIIKVKVTFLLSAMTTKSVLLETVKTGCRKLTRMPLVVIQSSLSPPELLLDDIFVVVWSTLHYHLVASPFMAVM